MAGKPPGRTPAGKLALGATLKLAQCIIGGRLILVQTHRPLLLIVVNQATSLALGPLVAVTTAVWKPYILQHLPRSSETIRPDGIFQKYIWFPTLQLGFLIVACRREGSGAGCIGKEWAPKG